jgi:hypothetical protein
VAFAIACYALSLRIHPVLMDPTKGAWVWFESDLIRVSQSMISRFANNHDTDVHPIYAIFMYLPTKLMRILGASERMSTTLYLTIIAGLWGACLYSVFRGLGQLRKDALLMCLFAGSTSSAIFWCPVTEIYSTSALTGTSATLSMTITNWMLGLTLTGTANPLRKFARISFDAFLIITLIFAFQKIILPSAEFFVPSISGEMDYVFNDRAGSFLDKWRSFFIYSIAIPEVPFFPNPKFPEWMDSSIQLQPITALRAIGALGAALWVVMLTVGTFSAWRNPNHRSYVLALCLFMAFQILLHSVYGDETFIYSMNYVPTMIVLASFWLLGPWRQLGRIVVIVAILANLQNNLPEYLRVTDNFWAQSTALGY